MRLWLFTLLTVLLIFSGTSRAAEDRTPAYHTEAKQAIILDYQTGMVLFEKNADEEMPTSSMSKTMTAYMVFKALKSGQISLDDTFNVSKKAWKKGGSKMFVEVGKSVRIEDLIRGVLIQSGNDATIVLAEGLAGTEENFAKRMTEEAHSIGMLNSNFVNASGWPDKNHYSTARDLARLGYNLIHDFPEYYHYFKEEEFEFNNIRQRNRNPLIYRRELGADGIKTGHTEIAGYGLIGSGEKDGRRVILVVNGLKSGRDRAEEGARLLGWGLSGFENVMLFTVGDTVGEADVVLGKDQTVPLKIKQDVLVTLPKSEKDEVEVKIQYNGPIKAPVSAGDEIGSMIVDIPGMAPLEYPLFAAKNVEKQGFFSATLTKIRLRLLGR